MDVDKKLTNEIAQLTREQYLGDADWHQVWRYVPVLSVETYWLRIRDGQIVMSDAEKADLADWSNRTREDEDAEDEGEHARSWAAFRRRVSRRRGLVDDRRKDYAGVPPLLRRRWANYHREFGQTAPRFLLAPAEPADESATGAKARRRSSVAEAAMAVAARRATGVQRRPSHTDILKQVTGSASGAALHKASAHHAPPSHHHPQHAPPPPRAPLERARSAHDVDRPRLERMPSTRQRLTNAMNRATHQGVQRKEAPHVDEAHVYVGAGIGRLSSSKKLSSRTDRAGFLTRLRKRFASGKPMRSVSDDAPPPLNLTRIEAEMMHEARERCLWAVKANYHVAFANGRLKAHGLRVLVENADWQSDDASKPLAGWRHLEAHDLYPPNTLQRIQRLAQSVPKRFRGHLEGVIFRRMAFVFEVAYPSASEDSSFVRSRRRGSSFDCVDAAPT